MKFGDQIYAFRIDALMKKWFHFSPIQVTRNCTKLLQQELLRRLQGQVFPGFPLNPQQVFKFCFSISITLQSWRLTFCPWQWFQYVNSATFLIEPTDIIYMFVISSLLKYCLLIYIFKCLHLNIVLLHIECLILNSYINLIMYLQNKY